MKFFLFFLISALVWIVSCTEEAPRSKFLEYKIGSKTYSYDGNSKTYKAVDGQFRITGISINKLSS